MYIIGLEKPLSSKLCLASTPEPISIVIMSELKISQCNVLVRIANHDSKIEPPDGRTLCPVFSKINTNRVWKTLRFLAKTGDVFSKELLVYLFGRNINIFKLL